MKFRTRRQTSNRRAAVAVEFAFIAPVFTIILLGMAQVGTLYETQNTMRMAAREGARLAAMDRDGMLTGGQTTNSKIEEDIRNLLNAQGMPGDEVDVFIGEADDHTVPFDVDDSANNLRYFQLRIEMPYDELGGMSYTGMDEYTFGVSVVFRNSRAALVQ